MKPIILLDVDGPLNPFAAKATRRPEGYETHRMKPRGFERGKGLRVWLKPSHGASLMELDCKLIWATAWEDEANDWIGPHIGLPKLEVIHWVDISFDKPSRLHWKTVEIVQYMNKNYPEVPFCWVDDEVTIYDQDYIGEFAAKNSRILQISPKFGLENEDFEEILHWRQCVGA